MKTKMMIVAAGALALAACGSGDGNSSAGTTPAGPIEPIAAPNGGDWTTTYSTTPEGGFLMGNPDAPVKLVEYASMTCPHCRDFEEKGMQPLIDTFVKSGRVSLEFRNYVMNGLDLTASVLARCGGEASFFGLTRQLYADQPQWIEAAQSADPARLQALQGMAPNQQLPTFAEISGLKQWVAMRGLPASKADQCLADQSMVDQLVQMQSDASAAGVNGTPTFSINGELQQLEATEGTWEQIERKLRAAIG